MDYKKYSEELEKIIGAITMPDHRRITVDAFVEQARKKAEGKPAKKGGLTMNYYIQGDAAKADQIKAAWEKLGIKASGYDFSRKDVLFFTFEAKGKTYMMSSLLGTGLDNIILTHPDYKELELPVEFKNGDIIGFNDCTHNDGSYVDWVGIYKRKSDDFRDQNQHLFHCVVTSKGKFRTGGLWRVFTAYPATKEQRALLFKKMREEGYKWDADKKELRKIQPHYDISNFKPFDKVLVRDADDTKWRCNWFSHYSGDGGVYRFVTTKCGYAQCIPFEGNEHLLGTNDMCDDRFINW